MQVEINGESTEIQDGCTVTELLERLQIGCERVAMEVGQQIVSKSKYDFHILSAGDKIEIVHFVGGG